MHPHKQRNGWTPRLAHGGRRKKSAKDSISYTRSIPATVELFTSQINEWLATVGDVWLPKRLNFSWERESAHCNLAMTYSLSYLDESEYMDSYSSPGFTLTLDNSEKRFTLTHWTYKIGFNGQHDITMFTSLWMADTTVNRQVGSIGEGIQWNFLIILLITKKIFRSTIAGSFKNNYKNKNKRKNYEIMKTKKKRIN